MMVPEFKMDDSYYKVQEIRHLTDNTFSLRLTKARFPFKAGQHISLGIVGGNQSREYSIYSGENDPHLEVLVKEVEDGYFSPKLKKLKPGQSVEVHGPFGKFGMDEQKAQSGKFVFIASGTGIAPFRSIIRTYPSIDYRLIHGVRTGEEGYDRQEYDPARYLLCTSRDKQGGFHGRVTDYLTTCTFDPQTHFNLCGNSNMIFDALEILRAKGFPREQIHCEVYF